MAARFCILFTILQIHLATVAAYKPVIIIHGVGDTPGEMKPFANYITKLHPNTTVYLLDSLHSFASFLSLWYQIDVYKHKVQEIIKKHPEGVNLIGYSQGGIIARGVVQTINNHNIDTFMSILGPQMGISGNANTNEAKIVSLFFDNFISRFAYSKMGGYFSLANIWRNEKIYDQYLSSNTFLPYINNEVTHPCSKRFKRNLTKLNRLVLIGLSDDNVLVPWHTSMFGSEDANGNFIQMRQQKIYKEDSIGLRTLDERGDITTIAWSGIDHRFLQFSTTFIETCVVPWLT